VLVLGVYPVEVAAAPRRGGERRARGLGNGRSRCAARHGQHHPLPVHLPAHQRACERHRTWLGRTIQIDVTTAPDIIVATSRASRLAREHGVTRLVLAETTARQETLAGPTARRRAAALALASPGLDPGHPDTAEAAAYPETVKMAAMLQRRKASRARQGCSTRTCNRR
jgi:hypothetical protein